MGGCCAWGILWWCIVLNEKIYSAITVPVWCVLFGAAFAGLCFAVKHLLEDNQEIWEENWNGIGNE